MKSKIAACALAVLTLASTSARAATGSWTNNAAGQWTNSVNWLGATIPNGVGDVAYLTNDITAARTITISTNALFPTGVTLGSLTIGDSASSYFAHTVALGAGATLTFDNGGSPATLIYQTAGTGAVKPIVPACTLNGNLVVTALTPLDNVCTLGLVTDGANSYSVTLDATSTGIVQMNGVNTYDGGTFINAGRVQSTGVLGTGPITVASGAQYYASFGSGGGVVTNDIIIAGVGPASANTLGAFRVGTATMSGNITLTGNARIGAYGSSSTGENGKLTNNILSGNYELELVNGETAPNASTIQMSAVANNTAGTRITALGAQPVNVVVWTDTALSPNSLVMNGGNLRLNGVNLSFSNLTSTASGGKILGTTAASTLTVGADGASTSFSGTFADSTAALSFTKVGGGTLTLTGTNSYSGPTTVSNGTLQLVRSAGGMAGASAVTVISGATFGGSGGVAGSITVNDGGILLLNGNNGVSLTNASLTFGSAASDNTATTINVAASNLSDSGTVVVNGTNTISLVSAPPATGDYDLFRYTGASPGLTGFKLAALPSGVVATLQDSGTAIQLHVTATLVESKIWRGNLASVWNPSAGNEWLGSVTSLPRPYLDGDNVVFDDSTTSNAVNLTASVSPTSVLVSNAARAYSISGVGSVGGFGGLTKDGAATLTVNTTNNYSGDTVVLNGTVIQVGPNNGAGKTVINSGATLQVGNGGASGSLSSGAITNDGVLALNRSDSVTYSGVVQGSGRLVQQGAGTSILTANQLYSGPTITTAGTLQFGNNTGIGWPGSGDITNNSSLVFYRSDSAELNLSNNVSGPGALEFRGFSFSGGGQAPYTLAGSNSGFTGSLKATQARISAASQSALGASPTVVATNLATIYLTGSAETYTNGLLIEGNGWLQASINHGAIRFGGSDNILSGPVVLAGAARIVVNNGAAGTLSGTLTGTNALQINGSGTNGNGTLTLSGNASSYTGALTVSGGTLVANGTLGASTVTVANNATLGGNGTLGGSVVVNTGGTLSAGTSVGLLNTGSETWNSGSTNWIEITNAVVANSWDRLNITGTLDIQATTNNPVKIHLATLLADSTPGAMDGFNNASNYTWTIATASGGILNFTPEKFLVDTNDVQNDLSGGNVFSMDTSGNSLLLKFGPAGSPVSTNADLISLVLSPAGTLSPTFASNVLAYAATNAHVDSPTVTVVNADLTATNYLIFNGSTNALASGVASGPLSLTLGVLNVVQVQVTAQDGLTVNTYTVNVTRQPSLTPPTLTNSVSGSTLTLSWPADHLGYSLQSQTNLRSVGLTTNWVALPGSESLTTTNLPIDKANPTVFYRLTYP